MGRFLVLGGVYDPVVDRVAASLREATHQVTLLENVWRVGITVPVGLNGRSASVTLDGEELALDAFDGIVVSALVATGGLTDISADDAYAEEEFLAAWLALLNSAPCRVINRAALHPPSSWCDPIITRAVAREVGVPTLSELIVTPALPDAAGGPARGAYSDLADRSIVFAERARAAGGGERHYSVCLLEQDAACLCCIRAGDTFLPARVLDNHLVPSADADGLPAASRTLLDELSLDYAFCIYYQSGGGPRFSRVCTSPPFPLDETLAAAAAAALARELAG